MDLSLVPDCFDIFEIYRKYCDITSMAFQFGSEVCLPGDSSRNGRFSREALNQLLKLVESRSKTRISLFDEIYNLMLRLDLLADSSEFSRFYDFVFFICRENGQKNVAVSRAVMAWRLVLAGRFQLLDQWCNFVETNQRHNISEDTWRQVLAFSRCVQENLEGYDPTGAWPVLIDDFAEHISRACKYNPNSFCNCGDSDAQPLKDPLHGFSNLRSLKRKFNDSLQERESSVTGHGGCSNVNISKRRLIYADDKYVNCEEIPCGGAAADCMEIVKHNSSLGCLKSPCAVEGCLSKGFAGLFSGRPCLQFNQERRVS